MLKEIAFKVLDKELRENWIYRPHFSNYTQYLSRDFPIMEDMHEHFKDRPYGENSAPRHREEMSRKYIAYSEIEVMKAQVEELKQKLARYESPDYVLVPRNPSEEMCEAGGDAPSYKMGNFVVKTIFKAMIEAVEKDN